MVRRHFAIGAGLAVALAFGSINVPQPAVAEDTVPGVASDATDIDKGLYTEQSLAGVMRSVQGVSLVNVSDEMKYFTKYESHGNYDQGFSYGDGYNALGYYQFDRRYSLIAFMQQAYNYNPVKYDMLKATIDRGSEISNPANAMYSDGQLTELGRVAQDAFLGAYAADPVEFSALQDSYAYNSYYAVSENWLKTALGIDISGRADCVKGMVWSITNMCGTGGCRDFFRWANLTNDMSDRDFVTALSSSVVNNVARKYPNQTQYHTGWQNRYKNELKDCLVYISEDEAAATAKPSEPEVAPDFTTSEATSDANAGSDDAVGAEDVTNTGDIKNDADSGDGTGADGGNADAPADEQPVQDQDTAADANTKPDTSSDTSSSEGSKDESDPSGDQAQSNAENFGTDAKDDSKQGVEDKSQGKLLGAAVGESLTSGLSKSEAQLEDQKDESKKQASQKKSEDESKDDDSSDKKQETKDDDKKKGGEQPEGSDQTNKTTTVETTTTATTNSKSTGGSMPHTGDVVIMASLASASLATFGITSIVSGKHKMDQNKAEGSDDGFEQ